MAPLVRTGGSRHTGLAAPPHRNIHFLLMTKKETDFFYNQALDYNISLNQKHKKLFSEDGIRLGTQQIARYNWEEQDIDELAKLLFLIKHKGSLNEIKTIRKKLIDKKIPHFTYNEIIIE